MTISEAVGSGLIAFGPAFFLFVLTIAHDAVRVIVLTAAAFCWLLSLLVSSILYAAVPPLKDYLAFGMVFSVLFQELFRYGLYKVLHAAEKGLRQIADTQAINSNKHIFAYVSGLGFGIMSGAFAMLNIVVDASGPGTVGLQSGSDVFFITSAITTCCITLLHTFWGVIFFNAIEQKNYLNMSWVVISHLMFSTLTLLNGYQLYLASIIPAYVILIITVTIAYKTVGGTSASFKKGFSLNRNIY